MRRFSSFLLAAVLGCGIVLATDGVANAQHRGGGGGHSSGGHYSGGGGHYSGGGGHYSGGGGNYYGHGYYNRPSIFLGLGAYPGYYGGGYYGGGYSSGGYYAPSYPSVVESSSYYESPSIAPSYSAGQPIPSSESTSTAVTRIRVLLPNAQAGVWLDGQKIDGATETHIFEFSNEAPGRTYQHKIAASWMRDGQLVREERPVQIAGGTAMMVDFTRPAK